MMRSSIHAQPFRTLSTRQPLLSELAVTGLNRMHKFHAAPQPSPIIGAVHLMTTALPKPQQLRQTRQTTHMLQELMLPQLLRRRPALDIHAQTHAQESLQLFTQLLGFLQPRRAIRRYQIQRLYFNGSSLRSGGSLSIISIAMIPRDQMSTLLPYSFCFTTSGAIQ